MARDGTPANGRTRCEGAPPALPAVAAAAAALLLGCQHELHVLDPAGPATPRRPEAVRALVFGDFGYRTVPQWLVARAMRRASAARPFDLALELGDNLYFCGPDPARGGAAACRFDADGASVAPGPAADDDPAFAENEAPLAGLRGRDGGALPVFLALGNHDVASSGKCAAPGLDEAEAARRRACLEVAHRTATWTMPARHYVLDRGPVRFVVVDTNVVVGDYGGFTLDEEVAFVRTATAACGPDRQCFLAGHHPPAAAHGYRVRATPGPFPFQLRMQRLLDAAGGRARAFLGGHVHTLEHLSLGGMEVFVSGSTAMGGFQRFRVQAPARARVHFATTAWGYAALEADGRGYRVDFFDTGGSPLYCCAADAAGPCRTVDCG